MKKTRQFNSEQFRKRLKELRKNRGLTFAELAEKAEMSSSTLNKFENDCLNLTVESAIRIAEALDVSLDYFIYGYGSDDDSDWVIDLRNYSKDEREAFMAVKKIADKNYSESE